MIRHAVKATVTLLLTCALITAVGAAPAGTAPAVLPDVDTVVIAEVYDTAGWLAMHQEVLGTPAGASKTLRVTLPARIGGSRTIDIEHPRFTVGLVTAGGKAQVLKITMAGKVHPTLAMVVVPPFQQAALEIQAGWVTNDISLAYGLSTVNGRLLELYFDRP